MSEEHPHGPLAQPLEQRTHNFFTPVFTVSSKSLRFPTEWAKKWSKKIRPVQRNTPVALTTLLLYDQIVTSAELKRWLEQQECSFEPGKGSHLKVRLGNRSTVLPMHGKKELGKGLEQRIKKDLGLK